MAEEEAKEADAPEEGGTKPEQPLDPVALKDKRIEELTNDLKRLQAEFDNYRKRSEKEWAERSKLATQRLMTDLLAVLDSFDKAIEDAKVNHDGTSIKDGLEKLHRQLYQTLQREGLREIKADGKFDPFMHEALTREEREDAEEGRILEVYQKGYALGQKAIRPAKVKVAKRRETEAAPTSIDVQENQDNADNQNPEKGGENDH